MKAITKELTLSGKSYTGLWYGPAVHEVPFQNERKDCILVTDEGVSTIPWRGSARNEDSLYVLFDPCRLEGIEAIASTHRNEALELVKKIAMGLKEAPKGFSDLISGIFPLYRIFIYNQKDILLLPSDAGSIVGLARPRQEKDRDVANLIKRDMEEGFTLIHEMVELLYFAASGVFPYEEEDIRISGYHALEMALLEDTLDKATTAFIMDTLDAKAKKQRNICGNRKVEDNLGWFLKETIDKKWNLEARSEAETEEAKEEKKAGAKVQEKLSKAKKTAAVRNFWRIKGVILVASIIIGAAALGFVGNIVWQNMKPPVTRDLDQEGIILHMVECQNTLNASELDEGFKKKPAQYNEVLNMFINNTTRKAYEGITAFVNADEWSQTGKPAIAKESILYGFVVESIEELGDNRYRATGTWYSPYPEEEEMEAEAKEGYSLSYVYRVVEDFTFQWNKRGWWECIESSFDTYQYLGPEYIKTLSE